MWQCCCCLALPERKEGKLPELETEGEPPGDQWPTTSLPLPPTSPENFRFEDLEYPYAAKALYFYKHPCLLWDSHRGLMTQQSVSLTTIADRRRYVAVKIIIYPEISSMLEILITYSI
ncbi:hypothetical protein TNCV_3593961 [Trichonephila clavipes]|nr:hypothetical protein TNCV_3593961 [Trichonephila clavipes]